MSKLNVLDLFSGIGGFSLGLERSGGFETVAFCESEPFCRRVLAKHWPDVPCYDDVRTLTAARLAADGIIETVADTSSIGCNGWATSSRSEARPDARVETSGIDVICGGFPCQDISVAGKGAGIGGERSGLWSEYARIIGEVRPRYVIVENVSALLGRGLATVLGDLAALGFDAEWHCIPASAVGAPHRRDRVWIVAYPAGEGWRSEGPAVPREANGGRVFGVAGRASDVADPDSEPEGWAAEPWRQRGHWQFEPDVGRVAHGVPARVDRLRALGNAVVPQIPELIGRAIMKADSVDS